MRTGAPTILARWDDRYLFSHIVYYSSMENDTNPIKEKCMAILKSKHVYVKSELAYLRYMMGDIPQEELGDCLNSLTLRELKIAIAAGVPGKCQHLALTLLGNYKEKYEAILEDDGNKATIHLDALDDDGTLIEDEKPGV